MMENFYLKIGSLSSASAHYLLTGIDGQLGGVKGIITAGQIVFETQPGCFEPNIAQQIQHPKRPGILSTKSGSVYYERFQAGAKLIICGGGHVGIALVTMAKLLDFHVTVIEDRLSFAEETKRAGADQVVCADFSQALKNITFDSNTYIVILTRGHRHDETCLKEVLAKPYGYLGLIGSRRRVAKMKTDLTKLGFSATALDRLHAPIGLPIQAATPAEIAISIAAEIINEKNSSHQSVCFDRDMLTFFAQEDFLMQSAILVTIIDRKGSAPRDVGAKMIVMPDQTTIGTIGGGCVEADVCRHARHLLATRDKKQQPFIETMELNLIGTEAEENGMFCGGIQTVCLEYIN
jgi:xanthine dehydrogenase accessory factor